MNERRRSVGARRAAALVLAAAAISAVLAAAAGSNRGRRALFDAAVKAAGYDVRFKVALDLQTGSASRKQKALYNVCTTPALVVKRAEGSW